MTWPVARATGGAKSTWTISSADTVLPQIAGIDTRPHPPHPRHRRHARRSAPRPCHLVGCGSAESGTAGVDLVSLVTTKAYTVGSGPRTIIAYDFGVKTTMLRHLGDINTVTVVPAHTADEVVAMNPDGVFLSNGPGDPEEAGPIVGELPKLLGKVPIFGICLGHQVLSLALGEHLQDEVRPPRRQCASAGRSDRQGGDHSPEPQLAVGWLGRA